MGEIRFAFGAFVALAVVGCGGAAQSTPAPETPALAPSAEAPPAETKTDDKAAKAPAATDEAAPADDAAAAAPDKRTMEIIAATVKEHRKEARECYEKGLKQVPGLKGDLVVHFVLTPRGKVKEAELNRERSTITEPSVVKCVIDVIVAIDFPKSSRGMESTVNYPFNFNP